MRNNYHCVLSSLEDILNKKNIEYQTYKDTVVIYFMNGDEIKIIIDDTIILHRYTTRDTTKKVFKTEAEFWEAIENL